MSPLNLVKLFCFYLLSLILVTGCIKTSSLLSNIPTPPVDTTGTGTGTDSGTPAVTAVGIPVGTKITKTIGPAGGSITSDDGKVDLTIPAGALSANTDISIQSVTNECPGSVGLSYDLTPNGTKFSVPVSLTFHYTDSAINETDPLLLYNVFQDSLNQWEVNDVDKDIDSVGKTVTFYVDHFTIFSLEPGVYIQSTALQLEEGQQATLKVLRWVKAKKGQTTGNPYGLIPTQPFVDDQVRFWAVNGFAGGNSEDGFIDIAGVSVPYTAPAKIKSERWVSISVEVDQPETIRVGRGKIITFQNHTYRRSLRILIGNISFDVHFHITAIGLSDYMSKDDIYNDSADILVNVSHGFVDIPQANIVNFKPTLKPTSEGDTKEGPGWLWIPDATGLMNITNAVAGLDQPNQENRTIAGILVQSGTVGPQFTIFPGGGLSSYSQGGDATIGWPPGFTFVFADSAQEVDIKADGIWGYTVTPRPR